MLNDTRRCKDIRIVSSIQEKGMIHTPPPGVNPGGVVFGAAADAVPCSNGLPYSSGIISAVP